MSTRKTHHVAAAIAAAALVLAAALPASATHAMRGPGVGTATIQRGHASPNRGLGWCYRHPYLCHRS